MKTSLTPKLTKKPSLPQETAFLFLWLLDREINSGGVDRCAAAGAAVCSAVHRRAFFTARRTAASFWFENFEVHARVVFCADDFEEGADRASGLTLPADHVAHVLLVDEERDEYAAFIDGPFGSDIVRMTDDRSYDGFDEFLILFCHILAFAFRAVAERI